MPDPITPDAQSRLAGQPLPFDVAELRERLVTTGCTVITDEALDDLKTTLEHYREVAESEAERAGCAFAGDLVNGMDPWDFLDERLRSAADVVEAAQEDAEVWHHRADEVVEMYNDIGKLLQVPKALEDADPPPAPEELVEAVEERIRSLHEALEVADDVERMRRRLKLIREALGEHALKDDGSPEEDRIAAGVIFLASEATGVRQALRVRFPDVEQDDGNPCRTIDRLAEVIDDIRTALHDFDPDRRHTIVEAAKFAARGHDEAVRALGERAGKLADVRQALGVEPGTDLVWEVTRLIARADRAPAAE